MTILDNVRAFVSRLSPDAVCDDCIADRLHSGAQVHAISVSASDGGRIAWLHSRGEVVHQETRDSYVHLQVRLSPENWARFQSL